MDPGRNTEGSSFGRTTTVLLIAILIAAFFDAAEMHDRIKGMELGAVRSSLLFVVSPITELSSIAGSHHAGDALRSFFYEHSGVSSYTGFSSQHTFVLPENTAQGTPAPRIPTTGAVEGYQAIPRYSEANPVRVLLIGDSMMGYGFGSAMLSRLQERDDFAAVRHYVCSSGFARPDYFSWPAELQAIFTEARYEAVIVMIGTNDSQDFSVDGVYHEYGTPRWSQVYRQRVVEILSILQANSTRVYWIAMPPMRSTRFHSRMMSFNAIYSECCALTSNPNVRFIPTDDILGDESGSFTSYLEVDGVVRRVRDNDGIHLSSAGGALIADILMDHLLRDFFLVESCSSDLATMYR